MFIDMLRERICNFRSHVVLVMFGENFVGDEYAFITEMAMCHDTLPFAKQVR